MEEGEHWPDGEVEEGGHWPDGEEGEEEEEKEH